MSSSRPGYGLALLLLAGLSAICGCSYVRERGESRTDGGGPDWSWRGIEEWAGRKVSSEFSGHNPLYIMGALLAEVPSAEGEPPPRLVFLVRDDAVSIEPRHGKWNTDELIAYYRGGGSFRDRDDWEEPAVGRLPALRISTRNRTAGQVVRAICKEMDYSHHWSSGPETHIVIGPDEETGDPHHCMRRRAYLLPQQRDWLDPRSLPCRLPPYGPGWAMDRSTGIVVVIGDGSHVGCFADILKSIGAELVYESYEESM